MGIGHETRREVEAAFQRRCGVKASSSDLLKSGLGRMSLPAWAQKINNLQKFKSIILLRCFDVKMDILIIAVILIFVVVEEDSAAAGLGQDERTRF